MPNSNRIHFTRLKASEDSEQEERDLGSDDYNDEDADGEEEEDDRLCLAGHPRPAYGKFEVIQDQMISSNGIKRKSSINISKISYFLLLFLFLLIIANINSYNKIINILETRNATRDQTKDDAKTFEGMYHENDHSKRIISNNHDDESHYSPKTLSNNQQTNINKSNNNSEEIHDSDLSNNYLQKSQDDFVILQDDFSVRKKFSYYVDNSIDRKLYKVNSQGKVDYWWNINSRFDGKYITVTNYIRARKLFSNDYAVTFSTQASVEFLHHTIELCKRWDGPISVAVYSPGNAISITVTLIKYMRECLAKPLSDCIRDKVTWHLAYDNATGPMAKDLSYPRDNLDYKNQLLFSEHDRCPKLVAGEPIQMIKEYANILLEQHTSNSTKQIYPINVLRNMARLASTTRFLMACDIELYPSANLVPMFEKFMTNHNIKRDYNVDKFVFVLPIFEVKSQVKVPSTKEELARLFKQKDAIYFHKYVCDYCQNFPNREKWFDFDSNPGDDSNNDQLSIFVLTQRNRSRSSWEPIFIGTNDEPLYEDRLSWDGRRDKMGQMYEMCLQNYFIFVVGNAFLVHTPGIKHIDQSDVRKRMKYIVDNNAIYDSTMKSLRIKYANSDNLAKC